jgi:hypothetical protein
MHASTKNSVLGGKAIARWNQRKCYKLYFTICIAKEKVRTNSENIELMNERPIGEYSLDDATTNESKHNTTIYAMKVSKKRKNL